VPFKRTRMRADEGCDTDNRNLIMKYVEKMRREVATDVTWNRVARLTAKGARALPSASAEYVTEKFPIIGWLPKYNYRWILNDIVAGLTVGLMLIPQALSYAKIATIPVQYGLMSSWLPSAIYAFMGSTKGRQPLRNRGPPPLEIHELTCNCRCVHRSYLSHRPTHLRDRPRP